MTSPTATKGRLARRPGGQQAGAPVARGVSVQHPGREGHAGADHRRRPRRPDDAQRPGRRCRRATLGGDIGHPLRPARRDPRRARGQRPVQPCQRHQQDLLPALPRSSTTPHPDLSRSRRDRRVRPRSRGLCRTQAAPGIRRGKRVHAVDGGDPQPQSDARGDRPRRLHRRPGVPARMPRRATSGSSS